MHIQADMYNLVIKARGEIDMKQIVCFGDSNTYDYRLLGKQAVAVG